MLAGNVWKFFASWPAQIIIWVTVLVVVAIVAYYVVRRFRDFDGDDRQQANEMLSKFREMYSGGDISETEFRNIKSVLGPRLRNESSSAEQSTCDTNDDGMGQAD